MRAKPRVIYEDDYVVVTANMNWEELLEAAARFCRERGERGASAEELAAALQKRGFYVSVDKTRWALAALARERLATRSKSGRYFCA